MSSYLFFDNLQTPNLDKVTCILLELLILAQILFVPMKNLHYLRIECKCFGFFYFCQESLDHAHPLPYLSYSLLSSHTFKKNYVKGNGRERERKKIPPDTIARSAPNQSPEFRSQASSPSSGVEFPKHWRHHLLHPGMCTNRKFDFKRSHQNLKKVASHKTPEKS